MVIVQARGPVHLCKKRIVSKLFTSQYNKESSREIIDQLIRDYFEVIETHCEVAEKCAVKLKVVALKAPNKTMPDIYVNMCLGVIEDIKSSIKQRREKILPYLEELSEKVITGHDCSSCSTGCAIKHSSKIPELNKSQSQTKELLNSLERIAVPMYENSETDLYRLLRNEMVIIQTAIIELFYIEEAVLIPKILEEQKNIHARH